MKPARGLGRTAQLGQLLFGQDLEHPHDLLHARDRCGQFRAARRFAFGDAAHQVDHAALGHHLEGIGLQVLGVHKGGLDLGPRKVSLEREPSGLFGATTSSLTTSRTFSTWRTACATAAFGFTRHFAGEQHGAVVAGDADLAQRGQAAHA
jgi:hypothetical protein